MHVGVRLGGGAVLQRQGRMGPRTGVAKQYDALIADCALVGGIEKLVALLDLSSNHDLVANRYPMRLQVGGFSVEVS